MKMITFLAAVSYNNPKGDQLFAEFYETHPELLFIVEIKNEGYDGVTACFLLNEALKQYPTYLDQIVVGTFHDEIEYQLKVWFRI